MYDRPDSTLSAAAAVAPTAGEMKRPGTSSAAFERERSANAEAAAAAAMVPSDPGQAGPHFDL